MSKNSDLPARVQPIPCPCCGQAVAVPTLDAVTSHCRLEPMESRVLRAVWDGRGLPVLPGRIFDAMYEDDPDGGPSQKKMYASFKVALCHLRQRIEGSGISIQSVGYRQGYRLVMASAQQAA